MIEFGCESCGRFLRVSEDKAGKKGRCPDCGSTIQVPAANDHEIDFESDVDLNYPLSEIAALIDGSLANGLDTIRSYSVLNEDMVVVIVSCEGGRTQTVGCAYVHNDQDPCVLLFSNIGNYSKLQRCSGSDALFNLLVDCAEQPLASVSAERDGEISVRHRIDTLGVEWSHVLAVITVLGRHADALERKYFLVDVS
jgi:DNA-directed RNA polymerase subunit RPC12/RpoP